VVGTQKFHRTAEYVDELLARRRDKICDVATEAGSESTIREHLLNGNTAAKSVAPANTAEAQAPSEVMSLAETTWTFTQDGKQIQESIDASGNYIANAGDEHIDHGTYAQVAGKQCFTSAMTNEGQECWTAPAEMEVGASAEITSDKGEKLTVTRQQYVPMTMPS
ncbi:MAG: hypothetical protein ACXW2T_05765, partial [Allosphingosinicella sp.]